MLILLTMVMTALVGTVYMILPATLVLMSVGVALRSRHIHFAYRMIVDAVQRWWLALAAGIIEWLGGVCVSQSGDMVVPKGERATIVICNHHCRLDWMFLWMLFARQGKLSTLNIALKAPLKKVPFFGWACQAFHFVFLVRNDRDGDLTRIRNTLRHCIDVNGTAPTVLIFPEGTDFSPDAKRKGRQYAAAKGLPQLEHLLHPRTAGLIEVIRALDNELDAIYDVTLSYDNHPEVAASADPRPSESNALLKGRWPKRVHFHIERTATSSLLSGGGTDDRLSEWVKGAWAAKEVRLAKGFPTGECARVQPVATYGIAMVGWACCSVGVVWVLRSLRYVFVVTLGGCWAYWLITKAFGGVGELEQHLWGSDGSGRKGTRLTTKPR